MTESLNAKTSTYTKCYINKTHPIAIYNEGTELAGQATGTSWKILDPALKIRSV